MGAVAKVFVRTPYNYDVNEASDAAGLKCMDQSLTKQAFAEEANINTLIERYGLDGVMPIGVRTPMQGDFTGITSFEQAHEVLEAAAQSFMQMPAKVRAEFDNDPAAFVNFCLDPRNKDRMKELGLVEPEKAIVVPPVLPAEQSVNPPAAKTVAEKQQ